MPRYSRVNANSLETSQLYTRQDVTGENSVMSEQTRYRLEGYIKCTQDHKSWESAIWDMIKNKVISTDFEQECSMLHSYFGLSWDFCEVLRGVQKSELNRIKDKFLLSFELRPETQSFLIKWHQDMLKTKDLKQHDPHLGQLSFETFKERCLFWNIYDKLSKLFPLEACKLRFGFTAPFYLYLRQQSTENMFLFHYISFSELSFKLRFSEDLAASIMVTEDKDQRDDLQRLKLMQILSSSDCDGKLKDMCYKYFGL